MKPDFTPLLSDLTAAPDQGDALVAAAQKRSRNRARCRSVGTSAALLATLLATAPILFHESGLESPPQPSPPVAHSETRAISSPLRSLTPDELLDRFGDQSVALVTWPDGRQQLLAILPPPARPTRQ